MFGGPNTYSEGIWKTRVVFLAAIPHMVKKFRQMGVEKLLRKSLLEMTLQSGPRDDHYKWSYNPYKWPYKWVIGIITLLIGVIIPFIMIVWAHLVSSW